MLAREEVETITTEVEAVLNNRPLTSVYSAPDEPLPIMPADIIGHNPALISRLLAAYCHKKKKVKFFVGALLKNTRMEKFPGAVHYCFPDNHITSLLGRKISAIIDVSNARTNKYNGTCIRLGPSKRSSRTNQ